MGEKIIEVVGPPGVGKSTIYKALCRTWSPKANWIHQHALLVPDTPNFVDFGKWLEHQAKRLSGKKITRSINTDYGLRFAAKNQALANFYWRHLSDTGTYSSREIDKRFRSAYFLFQDFSRYQAIIESSCEKPCIINEGLLQKSFFVPENGEPLNEVIEKYLSLLPLPHAIIFIDAPNAEVIVDRLQRRNKVIASHGGKDAQALRGDIERWQRTLNLIVEKAQKAGVGIIKVNGENSVNQNVLEINHRLSKL